MKRSCLLLVSGAISVLAVAPSAFAEPVTRSTEFSVTVNPYLNVTLSSNDVHLPITPSSGGTFGSTYFTATSSTNNALGYSLNLSIKDTNTEQAVLTTNLTSDTINVNDGTKPVIPTFSTNDILTSAEFSASTSADHLNHWAMSLNDTDHYQKVLSESTIATSDEPITDDVTTLNLATKLDLLTPPGSYSAYFNFEIVANVGDTTPPGTEGGSIGEDGGGNAGRVFPANSLLRSFELAYVEAEKPIYVQDNTVTGPIPGWRPMTDADQATIGDKEVRFAMQDVSLTFTEEVSGVSTTHGVCEWARSSLVDNTYIDEAQVMDLRDGKTYWIVKTADNKCWMSQNLDLNLDNTVALTHADTDLGWTTNDSSATWTPTYSTMSVTNASQLISGWAYQSQNQDPYYHPYSADPGTWYASGTWLNGYYPYIYAGASSTFFDNTTPFVNNGTHGHVGNYYNWAAMTAQNSTAHYTSTDAGIEPNSICPAGWKLPSSSYPLTLDGTATDDYSNLFYTYFGSGAGSVSTQSLLNAPLYFIPDGYLSSNGCDQGMKQCDTGGGARIASSAGAWDSGYYNFKYFMFNDGNLYASMSNMNIGMPIRCVAR